MTDSHTKVSFAVPLLYTPPKLVKILVFCRHQPGKGCNKTIDLSPNERELFKVKLEQRLSRGGIIPSGVFEL